MIYLSTLLFGMLAGFILNFPPRKIQLIILGGFIVTWLILLAIIFSIDVESLFSNWDRVVFAFSLAGYLVGYAVAFGAKRILGVTWK
jgi:hypothetical protein